MTTQRLPFNELTPEEVGFLHPGMWNGETAGVFAGKPRGIKQPKIDVRQTARLSAQDFANDGALWRARNDPQRFGALVFRPGQRFTLAEHSGQIVVFNHAMLVTKGDFVLDKDSFPTQQPFQPPQGLTEEPYYWEGPHLHYLHGPTPAMLVEQGAQTEGVLLTGMEKRVGMNDYYAQVGNLAVAETITVGEVGHVVTGDGSEMLTRTHGVYVFPKYAPETTPPMR